jgi:hypothetical protein
MPQRVIGEALDLVLTGAVANTTLSVPAGYAIRDIFVRNTTANAVTGGLRIGTTDGGTQVTVALAVAGTSFALTIPVLRLFSPTAAQTLFIQAVAAWNSASLDITITLDRAIP